MVAVNKKILIAAGGTGGHIFPGVAIASEFLSRDAGCSAMFVGTRRGLEERIIKSMGWPLYFVSQSGIKGKGVVGRLLAMCRLPLAMFEAMRILIHTSPSLFVSIGGYAAGPVAIMAWTMRIPVVLVEPNAIPGLTNRILGRFARKIFVSFDEAASRFKVEKTIKTGTPVRGEVLKARDGKVKNNSDFCVFVFGGSQGAKTLNRAMIDAAEILKNEAGRIRVIHQVGGNEIIKDVKGAYVSSGIDAQVYDFVDNIWECYSDADFVIARSGAGTVAELMALGIPSILVPYPFAADDHQRANAKSLVDSGGAKMLTDDECTGENVASILKEMLDDPSELNVMKNKLKEMNASNATKRIVDECIALMNG